MLNALSAAVPDRDRIVTIEDAAELQLKQQPRAAPRVAPEEHRGRGRDHDPRPRSQRAAHAARPDHRRRGSRRRGARHAPGDEHGPRGLALDDPRELAARCAEPPRDDGADGGLRPAGAGDPPQHLVGARPDRPDRAARRRHAPRHRDQRSAADGGGRDHAPAAVRVPRRPVRGGPQGDRRLLPTGLRPAFLPKFKRHGIELPSDAFGTSLDAAYGASPHHNGPRGPGGGR